MEKRQPCLENRDTGNVSVEGTKRHGHRVSVSTPIDLNCSCMESRCCEDANKNDEVSNMTAFLVLRLLFENIDSTSAHTSFDI